MATVEKKSSVSKKRAVISYDNMSPELLAAFKEKYPKGYADYMGDLFKVDKSDGSFFYAVSVEVPDAIYLVKMDVKIDDYDNLDDDSLFEDMDVEEDMEDNEFPDNVNDIQGDEDQMDS